MIILFSHLKLGVHEDGHIIKLFDRNRNLI